MTMALCLYCGKTKFGALVPCPYCQTQGTGHIMLDIKFSDHHFDHSTLERLGQMIERIREVCPDNQERYNAFFHFVEKSNPSFLQTTFSPEQKRQADDVLAKAKINIGQLTLTPRGRLDRFDMQDDKPTPTKQPRLEPNHPPNTKQKQQRSVWKFWQWFRKR